MKSTSTESSVPSVEPFELRDVMSRFATGVVVITVGGPNPHAMTANAFTSVSLTPPSILCSISHNAVMHKALITARRFAVTILDARQQELAAHFADKRRVLGITQFAGIPFHAGPHTGAPLISGALGWLECELIDAHDFGDHTIFISVVLGTERGPGDAGLLFFESRYDRVGPDVPA